MSKLDIGSRVVTGTGNDRKGVVMFLGQTKFAAGDWVGIRLDKPDGKNDGSVGGDRYFECEPMHGLFVKPAQVKLDKDAALADSQQKLGNTLELRKILLIIFFIIIITFSSCFKRAS
jgi:dynactin complex subunit